MSATEILASILCTYASSEYLHGSRKRALYAAFAALFVTIVHATQDWVAEMLPALGIVSKVPLVAAVYCGTLYADAVVYGGMRRVQFARAFTGALMELLPLFPLLSIAFAFVFLEMGELSERLGMGHKWLNVPIYYGVLYGPFCYLYVRVKAVARASTLLPIRSV